NGVARWNGVSWSPLGLGVNGWVRGLTLDAAGDLIAAGDFTSAGGSPALGVARWDGAAWHAMGSGVPGSVRTVVTRANGSIVVAGSLLHGGHVVEWNGTSWSLLGNGVGLPGPSYQTVWSLLDIPGLGLLAGGTFVDPGPSGVTYLGLWDGLAWQPVTATPGGISVLRLTHAGIVAGGGFASFGNVAVLNGAWEPLGSGFDNMVHDLHAAPDGSLLAAGGFSWAGGVRAERIARLSNGAWSALGAGVTGSAYTICALANGDVVVGGQLTAAGGVPVNNIARWDGTAWSPLGAGVDGVVLDLVALPDGSVVVAGNFTFPAPCIARWHAGVWSPLGAGCNASVNALLVMPNGDLVATGQFTTAGGVAASRIARWNGSSWSAIGTGFSGGTENPAALALLPNGDLVAGGYLPAFGNVARWNGTAWSGLGAGIGGVRELQVLPNGDLAAVGTWSVNHGFVSRWNGATWLDLAPVIDNEASALAMTADGRLAVGGAFRATLSSFGHHLAYVDTTCAATTVPFGLACPGSGGANQLVATTLPWLGALFTARGTGLANPSVVVAVFGFATASLPLVTVLPQAGPGCTLWVAPDVLLAQLSTNGTVTTSIAVPVNASLVGVTFHQQLVPFEISASGTVTSTNGLTATIGAF
ncbi:MAG TPA: hypothetical protein VFT55_00385, partial [Planctomycetota bacterium]|nr:hypothetical protein [Planctomycetota bacterium]